MYKLFFLFFRKVIKDAICLTIGELAKIKNKQTK